MSTINPEPKLAAASVTSSRASEHKIDMALEMLDVNSINTGRYRALVIQDATDKQAIKGFVKMARVSASRSMGTTSSNSTTMDRLRDVLNEYTALEAKFVGMITYDDPRLMELPIIISHGSPNESEKENLASMSWQVGLFLVD